MLISGKYYNSVTFEIETPDSTAFVTVVEDSGVPIMIQVHTGKAGTAVASWAGPLSELLTAQLPTSGISGLIKMLERHSSERGPVRNRDGVRVFSGPDGVAYALTKYRNLKHFELRDEMKVDEYDQPRGPSMGVRRKTA
jgi:hypothetical protein